MFYKLKEQPQNLAVYLGMIFFSLDTDEGEYWFTFDKNYILNEDTPYLDIKRYIERDLKNKITKDDREKIIQYKVKIRKIDFDQEIIKRIYDNKIRKIKENILKGETQ